LISDLFLSVFFVFFVIAIVIPPYQ
jgi:hypothetical protein